MIESARAKEGMGYALADAINASNHSKGWLIALRAVCQWFITDFAQNFKFLLTGLAFVFINRHGTVPLTVISDI